MAIDRFKVTNLEIWGNLVKTWSLQEDRMNDGNAYPKPKNLQELARQLELAQAGATIPSHVTSLKFVEEPKEVLVVRLPPPEMIRDSEEQLDGGAAYTLPPFYSRVFKKDPEIPPAQKRKFHAERIGDYTLSNCM